MTNQPPVILDQVILSAPLGLRFWDSITQRTIGDGLAVTVYPMKIPDLRRAAEPNRSGIYVFQRLPGLSEITIQRGQIGPIWIAPAADQGFIVEVVDTFGRFQSFQFPVTELPLGVYDWTCGLMSPLGSPIPQPFNLPLPGVPLFSSATRTVPAGMAVLRADLRQIVPGRPDGMKAAWAVLDVIYKNKLLARGLADANGQAAVLFPYPQPLLSSTSSGALSSPLSLNQQSWPVELAAHFQPSDPVPRFPDLCSALSQPKVTLLQSLSPSAPLTGPLTVNYGQETIVQTDGASELYFTNP